MSDPIPFFSALLADARAHRPPQPRTSAASARLLLLLLLTSPAMRCVFFYRLAHTLRFHGKLPGGLAASLLFNFVRHRYNCSIASGAFLGGGLVLPHPQGIVIGDGVRVGVRA